MSTIFLLWKMSNAPVKRIPMQCFLYTPKHPQRLLIWADFVFSTSGMVQYVSSLTDEKAKRRGVIIGTEVGLVNQLQDTYPDVGIWPLSEFAVCGTMKMTTLAKVAWSIETRKIMWLPLPDDVIEKARRSLEKMIEAG